MTPSARALRSQSGKDTTSQTPSTERDENSTQRARSQNDQQRGGSNGSRTEPTSRPNVSNPAEDNEDQLSKMQDEINKANEARLAAEAKLAELTSANRNTRNISTARKEPEIEVRRKPKGEAGDRKNGFCLREAMGLEKDEDKEMYLAMCDSVRTHVKEARLNITTHYRHQPVNKIADIFKLTRKEHRYLTHKRFPADWPTKEMLKLHLRNRRKYLVKRGRLESYKARKARGDDALDLFDEVDLETIEEID